jgi:photosystem II stability/assembly factor-like uncharacterized protein
MHSVYSVYSGVSIYRCGLVLLLVAVTFIAGQWQPQNSGINAQLRGVSAVSASVVWASGNKGTYLRTTDGGDHWTAATVPGGEALDFRDVHAVDANTAYLMATAGRIYKTTDGGATWSLQYNNTAPGVFLDSIAAWDANHLIALGDPTDGTFLVVITSDGGKTWNQVPPSSLPPALGGEAAFAASGTCIAVEGANNVWFATGGVAEKVLRSWDHGKTWEDSSGKAARVFRSRDRGKTWKVAETPIVSKSDSTGIFSIAFKDSKNGIIVGGDYKQQVEKTANAASTTDGGVTWKLVPRRPAGYRSCVVYLPGNRLITVGEKGADYSTDGGSRWSPLEGAGFHSLAVSPTGDCWAVGVDGRVARLKR